jgi:hypothetical protein
LFLLVSLIPGLPVSAVSKTEDPVSQSVTQAYGVGGNVQKGMLVRLKEGDSSKVVALKQSEAALMEGVIVDANDASVTLSEENGKDTRVYVAAYGRYPVLVSTQNGAIKSGDYLTISALDGVAMKADEEQSIVIGKAGSDFNGISNVESTAQLTDSNGKKREVSIGRVSVNIVISHNPFQSKDGNSLPGVLQKVSKGIADKPVAIGRVYLGLAVLLVTAFVAGSLLFAGVRAGLTAIGRNPLAKRSIIKGMLQATLTSLIVFIIGLFAVYLVLKL